MTWTPNIEEVLFSNLWCPVLYNLFYFYVLLLLNLWYLLSGAIKNHKNAKSFYLAIASSDRSRKEERVQITHTDYPQFQTAQIQTERIMNKSQCKISASLFLSLADDLNKP